MDWSMQYQSHLVHVHFISCMLLTCIHHIILNSWWFHISSSTLLQMNQKKSTDFACTQLIDGKEQISCSQSSDSIKLTTTIHVQNLAIPVLHRVPAYIALQGKRTLWVSTKLCSSIVTKLLRSSEILSLEWRMDNHLPAPWHKELIVWMPVRRSLIALMNYCPCHHRCSLLECPQPLLQ